MNIFDEITHCLSSKTRMRALFKEVDAHDFERIISRMQAVLQEKVQLRKEQEEKRLLKRESIKAIKKIMADRGVSLGDLDISHDGNVTKQRRNIQRYTFQYETEAGQRQHWQGATIGRLPKDFQSYLERTGKKRLDCIIETSAN